MTTGNPSILPSPHYSMLFAHSEFQDISNGTPRLQFLNLRI
jgi:hypothetical protein